MNTLRGEAGPAATDIERMTEGDTATLGKRGAFTGSRVIGRLKGFGRPTTP